jgi:hypothetical protein
VSSGCPRGTWIEGGKGKESPWKYQLCLDYQEVSLFLGFPGCMIITWASLPCHASARKGSSGNIEQLSCMTMRFGTHAQSRFFAQRGGALRQPGDVERSPLLWTIHAGVSMCIAYKKKRCSLSQGKVLMRRLEGCPKALECAERLGLLARLLGCRQL